MTESGNSQCNGDETRDKFPANRLAGETSPYLLQHAHNPVDWHPWDEEALEKARREDKPIFLSIGYSACHWCHVMERESFENESIAEFMNRFYVSIKVDREERPDLDDIYMNAVMAMTGSGGWPMSVFLTPDLKPFYGGTYFPPEGRYGMPGFMEVLEKIALIWNEDRAKALHSADTLTRHLRENLSNRQGDRGKVSILMRENALRMLESAYDAGSGGWGSAPKFPAPASLSFLLRQYQRSGNTFALEMAVKTLTHMAEGGMYDHLGGGFHRYSVDDAWLVPHFEKMLYDNAQLAAVYLEAWQVTKNPFFRRVACETLDYVARDMQDAVGGFHSAEDADSEGEEGRYYLWDHGEILDLLGEEDGAAFCDAFQVRQEGNFSSHEVYHRGKNIPHKGRNGAFFGADMPEYLITMKLKLLAARGQRVRPGTDDKIITAWNGLMISAFARAAFAWNDSAYRDAAIRAGMFIKNHMLLDGTLFRTWRLGRARFPGYLEDYASVVNAFLDLYECTGDVMWVEDARELAEAMIERFHDEEKGGFFATEARHKELLVRVKTWHDTAEPSGNMMAAKALFRLGAFYAHPAYAEMGETVLSLAAPMAVRAPMGFMNAVLCADYVLDGPVEIVFVGTPETAETRALAGVLAQAYVPCAVIGWAVSDTSQTARLPLTASMQAWGSEPSVQVCVRGACKAPVTTPEAFESILRQEGEISS